MVVAAAAGGAAGITTTMEAFLFATFPSIADPRSFESPSSGSDPFVMSTFPRIITQENLEALRLCNLWILMMLQRHSTI